MTENLLPGAERWLADFERALATCAADALASLFAEQSYLRDNGALTWDFRQFHGREAVVSTLLRVVADIKPANLRIAGEWPVPHLFGEGDSAVVEIFFEFDTAAGVGLGLLNARPDAQSPYGFTAHALYTRLERLHSVEPPEVHPRGLGYDPAQPGQTYGENRQARREFTGTDPEVLIVGSGQAGLITAAYLRRFGVSALVVDKNERVGDNWRNRYEALALHNPVEMNGFPFLPFPAHYPEYLPKDVVADWLEIYARYLDLDVWTATSFEGAERDETAGTWTATVRRGDGRTRVLHPRHIVHATGGIGGKPAIPELPGLTEFAGKVVHSSAYHGATQVAARKAIVVGVGASGHDIALDLHNHGVEVTMVQRGPVVVNHVATANLAYAAYFDGTPTELVDVRYGVGLINPLRTAGSQQYHRMAKEMDADLLRGLEAAGMRLGDGVDQAGWLDLFLRTGSGYYLNVGASEAIVDGRISVLPADRIATFGPDGARLADGGVVEADLIVLATGYQNRSVEVAEQFGADVAGRVGTIARLDDEGEWANMWCQTGQPGLWFNGGGINQVRPGSLRLALLVKAELDGAIPASFRRSAGAPVLG
ncbi:flavin-containing monooxygenase [Amycolatopsis jejuensis]|uniref:flavin-containing monooxygenase n=1 Tax=Amycolatopsis jejuensis TaxID=330084 RepID=UPI0005275699|nr:NAD(P)/FAD-dependent oxidoreductase [Amycolatopsis jejuensis]